MPALTFQNVERIERRVSLGGRKDSFAVQTKAPIVPVKALKARGSFMIKPLDLTNIKII